jgi:hypothetical protein
MPPEGLGKLKKVGDLMETRTRNLPACSILSQPTTPPRAPKQDIRIISYTTAVSVHMRLGGGGIAGTSQDDTRQKTTISSFFERSFWESFCSGLEMNMWSTHVDFVRRSDKV